MGVSQSADIQKIHQTHARLLKNVECINRTLTAHSNFLLETKSTIRSVRKRINDERDLTHELNALRAERDRLKFDNQKLLSENVALLDRIATLDRLA